MGLFSFNTQNDGKSIPCTYSCRETRKVKLINPLTGEEWVECDYKGNGVFGGKDIYELTAEMNGKSDRDIGVDMYCCDNASQYRFPVLVSADYQGDISQFGKPQLCEFQGHAYIG